MSQSMLSYQRLGILLACNLLNLALMTDVMAEAELPKTLVITGNGVENIATTIAKIELGVEIKAKTASAVQQEIAQRTSAVVNLLRSQNVKRLQTTGVRLNPNYERLDRNSNQTVITSYSGTNTVSFEVSTERVGGLLDKAVNAGASRIDSISFAATPEAISQAEAKALREASINAQDRAEVVLEALGLTADEIVNIKVDRANVDQPQPFALGQFAASKSRISTPIISGEQTVKASVTLQISY